MQNADGAVSFWEPLSQTKVMQIRQRETQSHQGAITHEVCCLVAQYQNIAKSNQQTLSQQQIIMLNI